MLIDPKLRVDFAEVIRYSQGIEEPKIEELLHHWHAAKSPIMRKFLGNKTSVQLPDKVVFSLNSEAKAQRLETFIEYVANFSTVFFGRPSRLCYFCANILNNNR